MAINLAECILDVQLGLADIPVEYVSDEQIFNDLQTSQIFIDNIKSSTFSDETFEERTIIKLATYFTYINYTSLVERQLGTAPTVSLIKLDILRRMALSFLRQMTNFKINDDLSIDTAREEKSYPVAFVNTNSVFTE
ncbi:MAG: hypothetical protein WC998_07095 [Candidatus Paceibacterota bacterium]|jgi:hypothetical protein